ncbi:alpha/beta hydrolase [Psychrobacter sp. FDAARGOS_221]|uniref:alpha/beta hydrolase n=1 Tax=Psychrobacter sp. FDAARGOS_221 TaxID=1975705 RepID=UPI000BB55668|nr:alpha/beta hydrolase [Psychrobacter sp. FDAARGOS_221]PNK61659.1 alpha/beta hydrolase [Psychrobacter sp. FDAARGOS_221]
MVKTLLSSDKIHTLNHTLFEPKQPAKATLLILHGMTEHSGRYAKFAQFLAEHGIAVLTYDHLGHGRSIRNADELGYFAKKHPMQTLLKDVIIMADILKQQYPDVPHFILGHSMGSFIARTVLQVHSSEFDGAILMGSSDYNPLVKLGIPLAKTLNRLQPKRPNATFTAVVNKLFNSRLKNNRIKSDRAWLCANPEAIKEYENDPLCGFDFTNNGYLTLFQLMQAGLDKGWADTIDPSFPMLFISGEDDPVGDMGKGIRKLTIRMQKQGFKQVEQLLYPLMRHEPLHEKDNQLVYQDLLNWLQKQIDNA